MLKSAVKIGMTLKMMGHGTSVKQKKNTNVDLAIPTIEEDERKMKIQFSGRVIVKTQNANERAILDRKIISMGLLGVGTVKWRRLMNLGRR